MWLTSPWGVHISVIWWHRMPQLTELGGEGCRWSLSIPVAKQSDKPSDKTLVMGMESQNHGTGQVGRSLSNHQVHPFMGKGSPGEIIEHPVSARVEKMESLWSSRAGSPALLAIVVALLWTLSSWSFLDPLWFVHILTELGPELCEGGGGSSLQSCSRAGGLVTEYLIRIYKVADRQIALGSWAG